MRYTKEKEKITGFTAEAWHIRYVGVNHAKYMQEHDLCLEEYIEGIEEGKIRIPSETEKAEEDPDEEAGGGEAEEEASEEEAPEEEPEGDAEAETDGEEEGEEV
jgi:hypothetical protein